MVFFGKIFSTFNPICIFAKGSILDIWQDPRYSSEIPVDTGRKFNVYKTSRTISERLMYVQFTSCVYSECASGHSHLNNSWFFYLIHRWIWGWRLNASSWFDWSLESISKKCYREQLKLLIKKSVEIQILKNKLLTFRLIRDN